MAATMPKAWSRVTWAVLIGLSAAAGSAAAGEAKAAGDAGFIELFNGKDLTGWKATGSAEWPIEDGCLVGTQTTGKGGDLFTERQWGDFELRVRYRMTWPANSGFWFRHARGGYQFDVLKYKRPVAFSGTLYCPGKMFITRSLDESIENRDGWNDARIWAGGDRLVLWLNGTRVGDCRDKTHAKGRVGIQVHGGNGFKGMKIAIRRIALRPLKAGEQPPDDAAPPPAEGSPVAPGAKPYLCAAEFKFTEGPAADARGNVYFTDQPNDRIVLWSTANKLSNFLKPCGRSNGLYFDKKGNLLACADENNQLWSIDTKGKPTVLVKDYQGKALNGPNDLWIRPDGGLYFSDPFYRRPYWKHKDRPQDVQAVYFLSADRKTLRRVASDLKQPNGLVGTPDGKTLYVADIRGRKTYAYQIQPDGSLTNRKHFCDLGSDGMTLDSAGNVYLTGRGVTIFDKTGKRIAHVEIPERWTANVCFGGLNHQTLFITASKALYALRMRTRGAGR